MTTLELLKFISDNEIEYHIDSDTVIIFLHYSEIQEFCDLLDPGVFDDDGIECHLKSGYLAIDLEFIENYYGIDLIEIFEKESV